MIHLGDWLRLGCKNADACNTNSIYSKFHNKNNTTNNAKKKWFALSIQIKFCIIGDDKKEKVGENNNSSDLQSDRTPPRK